VEDYPEIPPLPERKIATMKVDLFHRGLEQTAFAALKAAETTRINLTGVNLVLKEGRLRMVATNGYRLALKAFAIDEIAEEGEYLIEARVLSDLDRVFTQVGSPTVDLYRKEGELFFRAGQVTFMAKTLNEEFPDFERVIPKDNPIGLFFDRKALIDALQRIEITAAEESGAVTDRDLLPRGVSDRCAEAARFGRGRPLARCAGEGRADRAGWGADRRDGRGVPLRLHAGPTGHLAG